MWIIVAVIVQIMVHGSWLRVHGSEDEQAYWDEDLD